ncbi:hypothetical protein [Enterococcus sp. AZ163]|uniref:hypothetical protein n=1 Tax=Enterococcus sp. AZ163 TaxID=2774638 RepID=UPI003D288FE2
MKTTELQKRTIFSTRKRENLELKFEQAYQASKEEATHHSKNVAHLIQAAVVVMVRNAFYVGDFSYLAKNLIRKIFLEGEVPASVRHLCIYFEDYFTQEEWQLVISHLYKNQKEYHQLTEETRLHIKPLRPALTSGVQIGERKLNLKASFLDEKNKMHTWSLSNVVACLTTKERIDLLNIFGELTIFQKDGLRQFTEVVWVDFAIDERFRDFDVRNEEDPFHKPKESAQNQPKEAPVNKQSTKKSVPKNGVKENSNTAQSTTSAQPPADQLEQRQPSDKSKKKKTGKTPTDRMPSWKNSTAYGKKPKEEKDLEIEKVVRKKTGKKKNRKRNKRK